MRLKNLRLCHNRRKKYSLNADILSIAKLLCFMIKLLLNLSLILSPSFPPSLPLSLPLYPSLYIFLFLYLFPLFISLSSSYLFFSFILFSLSPALYLLLSKLLYLFCSFFLCDYFGRAKQLNSVQLMVKNKAK